MARRHSLKGNLEQRATELAYSGAIDDERQLPRFSRSLKLLLPDGWTGEVMDLSATGLRVRALVILEGSQELEATLCLPDGRRLPVQARVSWVNPPMYDSGAPGEFGLELLRVPEGYLEALTELLAE